MAESSQAKEENFENYGSVDLNDGRGLPPDWKRDASDFSLVAQTIVGHSNGRADAFLTKAPRERHQFSWVGRGDAEGLALRRMQGYSFVTDDAWTKNELLWAWEVDPKAPDGPRYCVRFDDHLMARPAPRYFEEKARRGSKSQAPEQKANEGLANHPAASVAGRDQQGRQLVPAARR